MVTSAYVPKIHKKSVLNDLKHRIRYAKDRVKELEKTYETINSIPAKSLSTEMWGIIENGLQSKYEDD